MASESAPLLGPIQLPTEDGPKPRIHYLDNLRTVLTILLIFQHSVLEMASLGLGIPKRWSLPLAMFVAVNKSFLLALFFFVAGYSTYLSLGEKGADSKFFASRSMKIGIPALLWIWIGRTLLYKFLAAIGLARIFDIRNAYKAQTRMTGPVGFVIGLLVLDYTYLALRWIGRRYPSLIPSRLLTKASSSRSWFFSLLSLSCGIALVFTFFSCLGVRFYVGKFYRRFVYDIREYPNSPAPFVIAYIAGITFPSIEQYLLFDLRKSIGALVGSEIIAYLSLGVAQHFMPILYKSIKLKSPFDGSVFFYHAGFNFHTLFYVFWTTFVFYSLSIFTISVFAQSPLTTKDWGKWTRVTYPQTYIHMVFIVLAIHYLPSSGVRGGIILKSILVGIISVSCSWGITFLPMGLVWSVKRISAWGSRE